MESRALAIAFERIAFTADGTSIQHGGGDERSGKRTGRLKNLQYFILMNIIFCSPAPSPRTQQLKAKNLLQNRFLNSLESSQLSTCTVEMKERPFYQGTSTPSFLM